MAPLQPLGAVVVFAGTLLALFYGAHSPCTLMWTVLVGVLAVAGAATAVVYVEELRKTLILSFGLRQPDEATFVQYCQHHHPFYSCFFNVDGAWAGRPQRLLLYCTSLWMMFMWSLYSKSKFGYLTTDLRHQLERCQYWTTILGLCFMPRVCVLLMESMLSFAQSCDDATLVDRVEEKVDMLAGGASAVQREVAVENISYCLLAIKNGVLLTFCGAVYVVTLLGLAGAAKHTSFFVWFSFIFQLLLALGFETLQTYVVYYYSIEYGELPYLRGARANMDRYYTDDGDIDDVDAQNAMHEELGL
eukprot:EG_transcript_19032